MPTAEKTKLSQEKAGEWYDKNVKTYDKYAQCVHGLLETLLKEESIPYQSISYRAKERNSFLKKCENKEYTSIKQIMDIAGIRIIAYTVGDVERICSLIEQEFAVDQENSGNKAEQLKKDQIGYLSVHYIVTLPSERAKLKEYRAYAGLKCEIQVRTLLQHTWAEFEHDRGYKFVGILPSKIERRLYLLAGMLEMADLEFQDLSDEIEAYGKQVAENTKQGNLDISIDSISLQEYMRERFPWVEPSPSLTEVIGELNDMGIQTLKELESLISDSLIEESKDWKNLAYDGFLRNVMILYDSAKYFTEAWKTHWKVATQKFAECWESHGINVGNLVDEYEIDIVNDE